MGQNIPGHLEGGLPRLAYQCPGGPGVCERGTAVRAPGKMLVEFGIYNPAEIILQAGFILSTSHGNSDSPKHGRPSLLTCSQTDEAAASATASGTLPPAGLWPGTNALSRY